MVLVLAHLALVAAVNVSLVANERIQPPEVVASVAGSPVHVTMNNPSGDQVHWLGSLSAWPMTVEATFADLAGNVGTASWEAKLPEMPDVPDLRLGAGPSVPPASGYPASLPLPDGAFNLMDHVTSEDLPGSELLVPAAIPVIGSVGPPYFTDWFNLAPSVIAERADIETATVAVDSTSDRAGWAAVDYTVLDGRLPGFDAILETRGYLKYSTFSLRGPGIMTGRFFDASPAVPSFTQVWTGRGLEIPSLQDGIVPQAPVNWSLFLNRIDYHRTSHSRILGLNPIYISRGAVVSDGGWALGIDSSGTLAITGTKTTSDGPYLIGVIARNAADPSDADTARFLFSKGLLAQCHPFAPATHEKSESLDGLTPGPIPSPRNTTLDFRTPIQDGSHWGYHFLGSDGAFVPAPLAVVDLLADADLPAAANPLRLKGLLASATTGVGTGNALKATFQPAGGLPTPAVRLLSRAFTGLRTGEVLTFAVDMATNVTDATHSPGIEMALSSGWGTTAMGFNLSGAAFPEIPQLEGTRLAEYQRTIVPWANEGWQTLSVNYTPPLTTGYFDVDGDGDHDTDDESILTNHPVFGSLPNEGWENELTVAKASLLVKTRETMTRPFHVWLDNFRVYRSAYELDLALSKSEYTEPGSTAMSLLPPGVVAEPEGRIDGSFDSYRNTGDLRADLSRIGWGIGNGSGPAPQQLLVPYGALPAETKYVAPHDLAYGIVQGVDLTGTGVRAKCLKIALVGPDGTLGYEGDFTAVRAQVVSSVVSVPGSGIYCFEAYVSKAWPTNMLQSVRTPKIMVTLNEIAPNPFENAAGAFFDEGGVPASLWSAPNPWLRVVGTAYIREAELVRGLIQVWESFTEPVGYFSVPVVFDDCRIYRVDDPAHFFDADLFDTL